MDPSLSPFPYTGGDKYNFPMRLRTKERIMRHYMQNKLVEKERDFHGWMAQRNVPGALLLDNGGH